MSSAKLIQRAQERQGAGQSASQYNAQLAKRDAKDLTAQQPNALTDLRPLSVAQRHLQNIASNSSRAQQLQSIQRMVQRREPAVKEPIQLKADVAQRLANPAPLLGAATSYHVSAADLGNGTGTTPAVRLWAQANAPGPNPINFRYAISNAAGTAIVGGWNGPFAAPNPAPAGGANWHAGHILARQNGGPGHVGAANWIMPQNPQVNMGHAGTYALWRAHEVAFHNLVGANGHGIWHVW